METWRQIGVGSARSGRRGRVALCAVVGVMAAAAPGLGQTPSFTLINGGISFAFGLSDDGQSAAGWTVPSIGFLWTRDGGRNDFGLSAGRTQGRGISGDGRYVVGGGGPGSGATAFRWSVAGGPQGLGTLPGFTQSQASDANFDGSIVVGTLETMTDGTPQAFRWTQSGGMQGLGVGTRAEAISGNGNVIVGTASDQPLAIQWTQTGAQVLPSLGGTGASHARAVNFDGSIVVGNSGPSNELLPTMWVNRTPIELLSSILNSSFTPYGVSESGAAVVGQVQSITGSLFAGVWTQATGIVRLSDYLTANGVTLPAGIVLESCQAVSADGLTFAGYTTSASVGSIQAWVATIPAPCPADLDNDGSVLNGGMRDRAVTIEDLLYALAAFEVGSTVVDLDDGSGTGTRDGAVNIDDLLYFLAHFEAGC